MRRLHRIPIAWSNLTHDKRQLLTSVAGISFAVFLMFTEVGFLNGMYDSQVELVHQLNADLIITNALKQTITLNEPFSKRRLYQAMVLPGVQAAYPLYIKSYAWWKNQASRKLRPIRVLAFKPEHPVFLNPDIVARATALHMPDTVLIDAKSKPYFGKRQAGIVTELSGKQIRVVGTFRLGTDFSNEGNVIMSDRNFLKHFSAKRERETRLDRVEIGIVQVRPDANSAAVVAALRRALPNDVSIYTKRGYIAHEMQYWRKNTPIGAIFGLGAALGFVIGVMICYQILYTDVVDHLPQFATLKAIGYYNRYVVGVVMKQALLLSCMGFVPGLLLGKLFYGILAHWTGLLMRLTVPRAALVLVLTVVMCAFAGSMAIRKVVSTDPAEVF